MKKTGLLCFVMLTRRDVKLAHVAQLVERILGKDEVNGSIPFVGSVESRDS